jgi:flagellar basal-body rod modification protein FlgD
MSNINLLPSNTQVNKAWTTSVPTGITTTAAAAEAAMTAKTSNMGQSDFLTLFTTQLKNQDPLDPVKNEAFVAQLAQFSQLEATTNMSATLKNFVDSQEGQNIVTGASLIGKTMSVPDAPAVLSGGKPIKGTISLPNGADGVKIQVLNDKGVLVATNILGSQRMGDMSFNWNGADDQGAPLPDGTYRFVASAVSQGLTSQLPVSTAAMITGVSQDASKTTLLQIQGGKTIKLSDVSTIGG